MSEILKVRQLCCSFGDLAVTSMVDLTLKKGDRAALIGPNGAGKTTLVNLIAGMLKPSSGSVQLGNLDVTHMPQADRVRNGLVRSFQVTRLFRNMTVSDNVRLAILQSRTSRLRLWRNVRDEPLLDAEVERVLSALRLGDRSERRISQLSYGEQRLVELALVLATRPRVLLLDEPAAGLPQSESGIVIEAVEQLPGDLAVLLIEHDMDLVFRLATEITVLVEGRVLLHGTPHEVASDERVNRLYLGEKEHYEQ